MNSGKAKFRLLIVGNKPPPIGGVSIHVQRLMDEIGELFPKERVAFYDLKDFFIVSYLRAIYKADVVHLHASSSVFRLLTAFLCLVFRRKLISTVHGDLMRFDRLRNALDLAAVRLAAHTIVLNEHSLAIARRVTQNVSLMSAFIMSRVQENIDEKDLKQIADLSRKHKIYATNAFDVTFDKEGREIYGILSLVKLFEEKDDFALVISDPSGKYKPYVIEKHGFVPYNVYFLSYPHDSRGVLKVADGFIRNTSTDGDSLSVHEALDMHVMCFCTDVVSRPKGTVTYSRVDELGDMLSSNAGSINGYRRVDTMKEITKLYVKLGM